MAAIDLHILPAIALKALTLVVLFFVAIGVYNIFFHPLAKYPGPFLAKFTDAYAGYHAWKGDIHLDMHRCHEKYGRFVRYAPNSLNVNTTTAWKDIYSTGKPFTKSRHYDAMVHKALNILTIRDRKEHTRRRKIISQGFSDNVLRNYSPVMIKLINKFCDHLVASATTGPEGWHFPMDMSKWCGFLSFDIMSDMIFGRVYDLMGSETYRYVPEAIKSSNVRVSVLLMTPRLKIGRLDKLFFPKAIQGRNLFVRFVGKLIRDTIKLDVYPRKDFFAVLSTIKDPHTGTSLQRDEIVSETTTLVVAGADTVATAASGIFFYLSHHPVAYRKAVDEVRSKFQSEEDIKTGSVLNSCRYLQACIDESMRMSPSVGTSLYRESPSSGAVVDGEFIPGGCNIGVPLYSLHHNPTYHYNPFSYSPERWLMTEGHSEAEEQSTKDDMTSALEAFVPFSAGGRSCLGKSMATTELLLMFATVLWRLDFKVMEGDTSGGHAGGAPGRHRENEFQLRDHVTSINSGPMLHFRQRQIVVSS